MLKYQVWGLAAVFLIATGCRQNETSKPSSMRKMQRGVTKAMLRPSDPGPQKYFERKLKKAPKTFDKPLESAAYHAMRRAPFGGSIPVERYLEAREQIHEMQALQRRGSAAGNLKGWTSQGPGNIGGRTRALVINPTNPDVMYAGGVSGGVWKTYDGGESWEALDDFLPNLAIGTMTMDPTDPQVIYVGTGEGYYMGAPQYREDIFERGMGIFRTTDGGATWEHLESTLTSDFYFVNEIEISSDNNQHLFAATTTGVWRSLDGGETWTLQKASDPNTMVGCIELAMRTDTSPPVLFAGFGSFYPDGLYRSVDNGETWTECTEGFASGTHQGRIEVAIAPSDQNIIYASVSTSVYGPNGPVWAGELKGVYRSLDGGDTWEQRVDKSDQLNTQLLSNPQLEICFSQGYTQGWYDHCLAVDPVDPEIVWIGGVEQFRSDDGGVNWGIASASWQLNFQGWTGPNFVHADQHLLLFHPDYDGVNNQTLFIGCDGGLFKTENALAATTKDVCGWDPPSEVEFTSLNHGYSTIQFYTGAVSSSIDRFAGGTQDNGTLMVNAMNSSEDWWYILGSDGGYCAINPLNPDKIFASTIGFGTVYRSLDGGLSFRLMSNGLGPDNGIFINPLTMDMSTPRRLWTGGEKAWRTENGGGEWIQVGDNFSPGARTSAIAVAPSNSNVVYFGFTDGYLYRTTNGLDAAPTWTNISAGLRPGTGYLSQVTVHPRNADIAYVTYSTFGEGKAFRTTDGGASWTDITGTGLTGLPDIPVHCIAINPLDYETLYVGTDLGAFVSTDAGATWTPDTAGLPHSPVEQLIWRDEDTLAAFTYGRGLFLSDTTIPGDFDGDGDVDLSDLAFLLGVYATCEGEPGFAAEADLNGSGCVDLPDLAQLLGLYGTGV